MTAELPWTSVGAAADNRGNPRVSTVSATAHGTSTANVTVVATARATVLSVANSGVSTMETDGSPRQLPWQFPRKPLWQFPRTSATIVTATRQSPWQSAEVRGNGHGFFANVQTTQLPRPSAAVRGHCRGNPPIIGDYHGSPRKSVAIATARAAVLSVANSVLPTLPTEVRGDCLCSFRGNCRGTEVRMG